MRRSGRRDSRDLSFPLIMGILLFFSLALDNVFDRLKAFMLVTQPQPQAGLLPHRPANPYPCQGLFLCSETAEPARNDYMAAENPAGSGVAALAQLEMARAQDLRELLYNRRALSAQGEAIEPRASNPSRFFPDPKHPTLRSGVRLTTSPPDLPVVENLMESQWGRSTKPPELPRRSLSSLNIPPAPAPSIPLATLPEVPSPPEPRDTRAAAQNETAAALPSPRLSFRHQAPQARPNTSQERLLEVCGRLVPESRAPTVSLECAPRPSNEPSREMAGSAGENKILMP